MQPIDFTGAHPRSIGNTASYESSENQPSTAVRDRVLESSHRVSQKNLQAFVHTLRLVNAYTPLVHKLKTYSSNSKPESEPEKEKPKSDRGLEQIKEASAIAFKLPIQNEKKYPSQPSGNLYQIEPDLYTAEWGNFLLQSAGYEEADLTKECGKYISKGEYATFFNIETGYLSSPSLSVLILKRSVGYGVAYFRASTICHAFCLAKKMHSSQIRDRAQTQAVAFFGLTKYEELQPNQKPLVLSFDNPDRTSTCFIKFDLEGMVSKEYIQGEVALSHTIDSLIKTQGTYMHFTHADLNLIFPPNELIEQETTLDTLSLSIPEKVRLKRLL